MSVRKLSHTTTEVYFNGCGVCFHIERVNGLYVVDRYAFRTLQQAITYLEMLSNA
jgi:hypothetical protein